MPNFWVDFKLEYSRLCIYNYMLRFTFLMIMLWPGISLYPFPKKERKLLLQESLHIVAQGTSLCTQIQYRTSELALILYTGEEKTPEVKIICIWNYFNIWKHSSSLLPRYYFAFLAFFQWTPLSQNNQSITDAFSKFTITQMWYNEVTFSLLW